MSIPERKSGQSEQPQPGRLARIQGSEHTELENRAEQAGPEQPEGQQSPNPSMSPSITLGEYVRSRRLELGLKLADVTRSTGRSHTYMRQIEADQVRLPSLPVLQALAAALSLPIEDLLEKAGIRGVPSVGAAPDALQDEVTQLLRTNPRFKRMAELWARLDERDEAVMLQMAERLADLTRRTGDSGTGEDLKE